MSNTSRSLAGTLCLIMVSLTPVVAQEPNVELPFEGCLGEAATAEQRMACYEPMVTAIMQQDPRGLPLAMGDLGRQMVVAALVCSRARSLLSEYDGSCGAEMAEVQARIQTRAVEVLPSATQEQLAVLQTAFDACVDDVSAKHGEITDDGFEACVEQRRVGALLAVTTASERWECFERFARDGAAPLVMLDGLLRMDSAILNVGPGTVRLVGLIEQEARFSIDGLNRRWNFGQDDSGYDFAIVIAPNGDGSYYDFSHVPAGETTSASQLYSCERTSGE